MRGASRKTIIEAVPDTYVAPVVINAGRQQQNVVLADQLLDLRGKRYMRVGVAILSL
jgi:hypothetical protein